MRARDVIKYLLQDQLLGKTDRISALEKIVEKLKRMPFGGGGGGGTGTGASRHRDLTDMPSATNTDHDARYLPTVSATEPTYKTRGSLWLDIS